MDKGRMCEKRRRLGVMKRRENMDSRNSHSGFFPQSSPELFLRAGYKNVKGHKMETFDPVIF